MLEIVLEKLHWLMLYIEYMRGVWGSGNFDLTRLEWGYVFYKKEWYGNILLKNCGNGNLGATPHI